MFGIVFAAFKRVDKLSRDAQSGKTGIVVHVFEPLVDDGAGIVLQKFDVPAVLSEDVDDDAEMDGQHVGDQDLVRLFHFRPEFGVIVAEVDRLFRGLNLSFHRNASSVLPRRQACCEDGS